MARGRTLAAMLAFSILANAFCLPASSRLKRGDDDHMDSSKEKTSTTSSTPDPFDDDDDDNFGDSMHTASTSGGGSNLFSLLNLAGALFPGSSGTNVFLRKMIRSLIRQNQGILFARRRSVDDNTIDDNYPDFKPPSLAKQELEDSNESSESTSEEDINSDENPEPKPNSKSKEESGTKQDISNEKDDEPPEGDGQGGGLLGLLAGLSGGEESDLGTLLSTVGGILASLSGGDDFDLNGVIGSGIGLLAGLLSQGEENPGSVLAGYLLTSLDTITEGGAKNNGAFFGSFLSKLIKGTSMGAEEDDDDEEKEPTTDSAGFILSFIMGLLGDMSKGSSSGSSSS